MTIAQPAFPQSTQVFVKSPRINWIQRRQAAGERIMPMPAEMDDVVEVSSYDRREDVRVIVNLPARYMLSNKRTLRGARCEFACRIVNVSLDAMALAAPVPGPIGERVILYSEQLGRLHGMIIRLMTNGFVISIAASPQN